MLMNMEDPQKAGRSLITREIVSFSRMIKLHGITCLLFFLGTGATSAASFIVFLAEVINRPTIHFG
jgi:hypothetical protein